MTQTAKPIRARLAAAQKIHAATKNLSKLSRMAITQLSHEV